MPKMINAIIAPSLMVLALSACGGTPEQKASPPTPVRIATIRPQAVPNVIELPGRIESVRMAEVRARSDGIVLRRLYEEGTEVKAGTPLFLIDPRDYRAQVQAAEAALQRATAARENAASIVTRYAPLMSERAVSAQEYDAARSELRQAEAQVAEARASVSRAKLSESYTTVRAPIAGRAGRAEVTEGALVSGAEATLMTRVDNLGPVYAVFAASNASILDTIREVRSGALKVQTLDRVEVRLELENGDTYGPVGHINFTSPVVDPETGTQSVRASFDNPQGLLRSGQFVRGRITAGSIANGITVPARAVQLKAGGANVSVLGKDDVVSTRKVTLGTMAGKDWIIRSGLKTGDRVIVEGWQKARPGQKAMVMPAAGSAPIQTKR